VAKTTGIEFPTHYMA